MACNRARIGDVASFRKQPIEPEPGVTYYVYSLPAFDNGHAPEVFDGSEVLSSKLHIEDGDILVNKLNMRFKRIWPICQAAENSVCSTEFVPLVPNDHIDPRYLYYVLLSDQFTHELSSMRTGTSGSHQRVKPEWILNYEFELPDKPTQRKIGSFLGALDSKIVLNQHINDYLFKLAIAKFDSLVREGCSSFRLDELIELEDSKRIPLNSRDRAVRQGPYPYYGAAAIMDYVDGYIFDGARILLGEDGTVTTDDGHPVLQYVWGKYWVNNHAHVLRASGVYSLEAIYIALSRASASELITGAVQPKINQKNLRGLLLTMPEPSRLDYLDPVFKSYRVRTEESRRLEKLRDALLPKLMSGEIDVSKVELPMLPNNHLCVD